MLHLNVLTLKKITLSSREVAPMLDVRHDNLIRNVDTYVSQMKEANKIILGTTSKLRTSDYFIKSKLKLELQTKEDFKEMTDAINQVKKNPKPYNYTKG